MRVFRRILAAVDTSPPGMEALRTALGLAQELDSELDVLHVYSPNEPQVVVAETDDAFGVDDNSTQQNTAAAQECLEALLTPIPEPWRSRIQRRIAIGHPAQEVLRLARSARTDLIVIGTHGRRGLERLLLGSVADEVIKGAPCAVLAVRDPRTEDLT